MTPEQRDLQDEAEADRYEDLYNEVEAQMVTENILDGGACDYRPDGAKVHALVVELMGK